MPGHDIHSQDGHGRIGGLRSPRPYAMAAVVLGVAFTAFAWVVVSDSDGVTHFDDAVGSAVHSVALAHAWLVDASLVLDAVGGGRFATAVVAVVAVVLLVSGGARRPWGVRTYTAGFLVVSAAGGSLINSAIKQAVERPRPPWNGLWLYEGSFSFPSGHSQAGLTVWAALALIALVVLSGWLRWVVAAPLLVLAVAIGVSRTVIGVHWPTDVLGGWAMGGAWMLACAAVAAAARSRFAAPPRGAMVS
jgi:undecaprenyl-diphosphatase